MGHYAGSLMSKQVATKCSSSCVPSGWNSLPPFLIHHSPVLCSATYVLFSI